MGWSRGGNWLGTIKDGELPDGLAHMRAGKGSTEHVATQYPGPRAAFQMWKLIQIWVPGPCQEFRFRSCEARRVQAPEFLRSIQPASFHSGLGDRASQTWLRVGRCLEVTGDHLERRVGPGGGIAQKPCGHVCWGTFPGLEMSRILEIWF